jgi:hypothetical protein
MVSINQRTSHFDIAAVTSLSCTGNRILKYQLKDLHHSSSIPINHWLMEPLCYPILFPWGTGGWGSDSSIPFNDYLCCRLLMPDMIMISQETQQETEEFANENFWADYTPKKLLNKAGNQMIPVNRFQCLAQLGQIYLTDMVSRNIDRRLDWHRRNQHIMMGGQLDSERSEETFLSQSFHGSKRHLQKLSVNALTVVSELGKPTIFITLTCNTLWTEIQEMLLPGQTAFNRPDVVCRVFHERLKAFLHNLRNGKYFDDLDEDGHVLVRRKVLYEMRVTEYQHRGLPHAHLIVKLENAPDSNDEIECCQWIDQNISCELPHLTESSSPEERHYHQLIQKHMKHECSTAVNGCLDDRGHCRKGFMDTVIQHKSTFHPKGFVKFRRRTHADLRVVPHVRRILTDWEGHAHTDWCASSYTPIYLYKYLYTSKGAKKVKFRLDNADDINDKDEISRYIRGRYLLQYGCLLEGLRISGTIFRIDIPHHFIDIPCL